ncbi:hypothetical protein SAMN05444365_104343 [Micromonospora pattaloongensis]|uniref:Uncharacterized protein n=1 Tax=Micromonospora pattaloongensis TaxID=405436 RepID=A0A1H3P5W5_9ACTN|nr:hypothetical protein SAMN05444365_104343 [Micromonospora pattaloongensis]
MMARDGDGLTVEEPGDSVDELHQAAGTVTRPGPRTPSCLPLGEGVPGPKAEQHAPWREEIQRGRVRGGLHRIAYPGLQHVRT